ncbi:MAG: 2,3-bisphosphoglycerate-independent phosphoglycerate mutase [Bacilli bacterium]
MKKILTIILDGFGLRDEETGNAIKKANMVNFNKFYNDNPHTTLHASGHYVGLNDGQFGNSEIGHMTIGAGRLIKSREVLVDEFLDNIDNNETDIIRKLKSSTGKNIHIMGLCSNGNVHAGIDDFIKMYEFLVKNDCKNIYFHLITDGRDTEINSSYKYIKTIEELIDKNKVGSIATICGRYYAMDRDGNYDRTLIYYDLITKGKGINILNIQNAINAYYNKKIYDEFLKPMVVDEKGLIKDGDILLWMNYRTDRSKQILLSLSSPKFDKFETLNLNNLEIYTFFNHDKQINANILIDEPKIDNSLGLYLAKLGVKQARIAESEKYPHVTYFFDEGVDGKITNVDKFHIPSPEVATYDLKPEMSIIAVTKKIITCLEQDYDFILANFANPDMVGHTGNFDATVNACMAIDICLAKIFEYAENNFYKIIILADHGNADTMLNEDGSICTTHSMSDVPFVINDSKISLKDGGDLTNVAPTILDYMDISIPEEMTSESLIIEQA